MATFTHHFMARRIQLLRERRDDETLTPAERQAATEKLDAELRRFYAIEHERTKIVLTNVAHANGSISAVFH